MFKKFVFGLFIVGMLVGPLTTNASTFTSLKAQLEYISTKIANFSSDVKGEVLGVTSSKSVYITATPINVPLGGSTTLTWVISPGATSCVASSTVPNSQWQGNKNPNGGSQVITNMNEYTGFGLECRWSSFEKAYQIAYVQIIDYLPQITFTANPSKVPSGGSSVLSWVVTGASECRAGLSGDGPAADQWWIPSQKGVQGSQEITNIVKYEEFGITCKGVGGWSSAQVRIESIPVIEFKASPSSVYYGGSTTLTWKTKETYTHNFQGPCVASTDWTGNKAREGSQVISNIKNNKTFTLTCYSRSGDPYKVIVKVNVQNIIDGPKCDYPVPPKDCTYIQGPEYNPVTNCGMILDCKLGDVDDGSKLISTDTSSAKVTTTNNFCSFTFTKNLGYGNIDTKTSKDVSYLQAVLVDEKLLPSSAATGKFYAQTRTALANFQKKYKLTQTGKVDANTRIKLNSLFQTYCQNS